MPRPQSNIWQYFSIVDAPDGKGRKAKCNYCNHQQACGVTRLHQHLLRKCTKIPETLHEDLLQKEAARGKSLTLQATQRSAMTQEVLQLLQQRQQQQQQRQQEQQQPSSSSSSSSYQTIEIDRALSTIASNSLAAANSAAFRTATVGTTIQQQQQSSSTPSSSLASNNNNNINNRYENISSPSSPSPHSYSNHHHHHLPHHPPTSNSHHSSSNSNGTTDTPGNLASSDPMSQRMLDYNLARALFSASIPFNVVDNQEFATFLKRMRPGYAVPKSHVLQQYLLKEEHYDLIPQEPQNQQSSLVASFDSGISNGMGPRSPSSSNSAPSTSSAATISRIIHAHSVSGGGNSNNVSSNNGSGGNNTGSSHQTNDIVSSSSAHHHSNHNSRAMHRPTDMDGSL